MALLEIDAVTKVFGSSGIAGRTQTVAVDGVSLAIEEGETVGVVGESGSGKSTLGRMALHLLRPDSGEVRFDGVPLRQHSARALRRLRRDIQCVFQDPFDSLDRRMLIRDLVAEPMRVHRLHTGAALDTAVIAALDRVGLGRAHLDRYPHEFSGGQLQRIAIARALATEPRFVVCDEPVAALDVSIRAQVINLLIDLQQECGLTYLFISHDLSIVRHIADRLAVMRKGTIVEAGPAKQVFDHPQHDYTRELIDAIPRRDPRRRHLLAGPTTAS